ncbi:unnamed protein product [Moneuplotes crassus]|uniref:BolA-like protein n=1 Tax=Euplotes crassus TaxID=5936 RepID=A0AAD2D9M7_EUPCR|nr:unnamed protein product [Moneuplotes crassus]
MESETSMQDRIESKIKEGFKDLEFFHLKDQSDGCGAKFFCIVISEEFEGLKLLDRQRKVNDLISDEISEVHALELKTWTPKQWETKKEGLGF